MIRTPCASTSSTISCNMRSSPAISNDGASHGVGIDGFGAFRATVDNCTGERRWTACDGIEIASTWSNTAQIHFLVGAQDGRCALKDVDVLKGGDRQEGQDRSRENE